jgi:hypothetical protein
LYAGITTLTSIAEPVIVWNNPCHAADGFECGLRVIVINTMGCNRVLRLLASNMAAEKVLEGIGGD